MPTLSIIIPALNEASVMAATLEAIAHLSRKVAVIVVDGGSTDNTCEIARARGAEVIASEPGRGLQLHRGALAAQADILWFLHADTIVPAAALERIVEALADPQVVAGNFEIRFEGRGRAARFMTWLYPQLRRLGLSYGDSAIFVRREAYERTRGFKPFPIFEDLDLLHSLKKLGRIVHVPAAVVTSSRRFEKGSFMIVFARWTAMQLLYWVGIQPTTLGRFDAPVRNTKPGSAPQ